MRVKKFDWDKGNVEKNLVKHKVDFREAEEIFFNKKIKFYPDWKHSIKEDRFIALGVTNKSRKLTIIFTKRKNEIRIISARDQNKRERKQYGQN
ncbi:hypothetical protein COX09_03480 [Candidatus Beckwithbacteria bacterium CG23_combo_of_CG06-09_8_20_14_all_47_9]|uniref:BrnT family toxin n=1 Tax=Candidatus Beckwithbacteria bacterium CG23_combo_of_CG06-09_8_20_14_all_47_9 TaxID=1974498 RepID=A0A2H0B4W0_9BACT|nr:MAG: hypothetical protein COX09_03480 [Candidatus Beckwithbacteria bacterium CG23_combo_of_CG06-09_8_20_14_all_47_9]